MGPAIINEWERAARHFADGKYSEAGSVLKAILGRDAQSAQAWLALARVGVHSGAVQDAFSHSRNAARCASEDAGLLCDIATTLLTVGAASEAHDCVERAVATAPVAAGLCQRIALQFQNLNEHDAALTWMEHARAAGLRDFSARFCLAVQLIFHGRMDEAEAELEACEMSIPPLGRAMVQLTQLRRQAPNRNHLGSLAAQIAKAAPGSEDHAALEFSRYKEFEDLGRYEEAWNSLASANATMHALLKHNPVAEQRTFETLMEYVDALGGRAKNAANQHAGPIPIFIVGMPRSGTTLLDRMLGNHSRVRVAGELGTFRRSLERVADRFTGQMLDDAMVERLPHLNYAALGQLYLHNSQWLAKGRPFYIDKLPRNWLLVPLIRRALPQARILHMVRSPMDTAFSNLRSYFGHDYPYSYHVDDLASHYRMYRKVMARWHETMAGTMLDVSYADLVADPEGELRKVFAFCGLQWEAGCADLARNRAPVATLSATQVRDSVHKGFSQRWRPYTSHLSGLQAGFAQDESVANDIR